MNRILVLFKKLMLSIFTASLLITGFSLSSQAQEFTSDDTVLLTVADEKISKSEFLKVYFKNSKKDKEIDQKSLDEYLDLYINFKLKVAEAKALGLDTTKAFRTELDGYRKQLAQPYLNDKEISEALLNEAYERKNYDIRASHILVKVAIDSDPKDTLLAYQKISKLRKRILDGEKFEEVAKLISEDPSAKENGGDLGYFTVFQMIYPFESMAYNTSVGEISKPVRTQYGYHIIKVTDKRPALGEVKVAHIMVVVKKNASEDDLLKAKTKIDQAYLKLQEGISFKDVAKQYSEDDKTAANGGSLPEFTTGKMVGDFEMAVAGLKKTGDYTKPVKTDYGWHIIQLMDKKGIPEFNQIKSEIKAKISKDSRSNKPKEVFVDKIKNEYGFTQNLSARNDFYTVLDDSYFKGQWKAINAQKLSMTLLTLGNNKYTQQDFARFIEAHPSNNKNSAIKTVVNNLYGQFVQESCIAYEDSKLETKYPDFKSLIEEYRDGILLFELTDQKVWSRAIKDTSGLLIFHNNNKNNYMWNIRLDAEIYTCSDINVAKKTRKLVKSKVKKNYTKNDILKLVNTDTIALSIEDGAFAKNENEIIDTIQWKPGFSDNIQSDSSIAFVYVNKILQPTPKTLTEAKGLVTADYQTYLEKEWIEVLRKKYKVEVNQDVLKKIK